MQSERNANYRQHKYNGDRIERGVIGRSVGRLSGTEIAREGGFSKGLVGFSKGLI